jgi:hypothetical protein
VEPVKRTSQPPVYTEADLDLRLFYDAPARPAARPRQPSVGVWSRRLQRAPIDRIRPMAASSAAPLPPPIGRS